MNRRDLLKQVLATTVAGSATLKAVGDADGRTYESATISVRLVEQLPGVTSVILTEHGDANYVVVEAFYWTTIALDKTAPNIRVMLHKEATTFVAKGSMVAADLPMSMDTIVFLRVKEMRLLNQSEFGEVPE